MASPGGPPVLAPVLTPPNDVDFAAVVDLNQQGDEAIPQLRMRMGYDAITADWPASLYVTFQTPQGASACTAALIGPQVIRTAAHCVPASGLVRFSFAGARYNTS